MSSDTRRIYRWDLDKTYLQTEFDTLRQVMRAALESAREKKAIPGATALIRELRTMPGSRLCIISGSPTQMREVLAEKLHLDGIFFDELVLKNNLRNLVRGRFKALRGQVGYKLPALLESRVKEPLEANEVLFGDDAEADAFIYSLYADMVARRVSRSVVENVLEAAEVYPDEAERVWHAWDAVPLADPVQRIFINLSKLTPPAHFTRYGARVVPVFNYFQAALVLLGDRWISSLGVGKVMIDLIQVSGYNTVHLANSLQDLLRRGFQTSHLVEAFVEALKSADTLLHEIGTLPDILAALSKRVAALGDEREAPRETAVDYLELIDEIKPGGKKNWYEK